MQGIKNEYKKSEIYPFYGGRRVGNEAKIKSKLTSSLFLKYDSSQLIK